MSKVAICSDIHVHPFPAFANFDERGLNTRLLDVCDVLHWILYSAELEKCEAVLICGDLLHTKKIDIETLDILSVTLSKTTIPIIMIAGNHDSADKLSKFISIRAFNGRATILDWESKAIQVGGYKIVGMPYVGSDFNKHLTERLSSCGRPDILMLHAPLADAMMGSDFITHEGEGVDKQLLSNKAELIAVGHYHIPQLFKWQGPNDYDAFIPSEDCSYNLEHSGNVLVPGSPLQHNIGDCNTARGFWIYDGSFLEFRESKAPKFINVTAEEASNLPEETFKNNFITVTAEDHREAEKASKKITNSRGVVYGTATKKVMEHSQRIEFKDKSDYKATLKQYCETMKQTSSDVQEMGVTFIEEARKQ